jgi:hypothetical protein
MKTIYEKILKRIFPKCEFKQHGDPKEFVIFDIVDIKTFAPKAAVLGMAVFQEQSLAIKIGYEIKPTSHRGKFPRDYNETFDLADPEFMKKVKAFAKKWAVYSVFGIHPTLEFTRKEKHENSQY